MDLATVEAGEEDAVEDEEGMHSIENDQVMRERNGRKEQTLTQICKTLIITEKEHPSRRQGSMHY